MIGKPAILLTGTAPHSMGSALAVTLSQTHPEFPIIAVDVEHNPVLDAIDNIYCIELDLNPLTASGSYHKLNQQLVSTIKETQHERRFPGVGIAILAAGAYDSGPLVALSQESRMRLVGVNVCGKIELLHAILKVNQHLNYKSSDLLTIVDIGAIHGLTASPRRSIYSATKASSLDLCISLQAGGEARRVIYIAPGPIDTQMLHRNYWVCKEEGPEEFFELVQAQEEHLYEDIFKNCSDEAFVEAAISSNLDAVLLAKVFARYRDRREAQFNHAYGILQPCQVAKKVVNILRDPAATNGVYILTAPSGNIKMKMIAFSELVRMPLC